MVPMPEEVFEAIEREYQRCEPAAELEGIR
jgi:hypothetical protein